MLEVLESDKPFFSRARTESALRVLSESVAAPGRLVVFAGAGVTIDRSGLSWRAMVEGLLEPYIPAKNARDDIFEENSVQAAASLAVEYYRKHYGERGYRARIADRLRILIYAPGGWQSGDLVPALAGLARSVAERNSGIVVATTNYDDFLIDGLSDARAARAVKFPYDAAESDDAFGKSRRATWTKSIAGALPLFESPGSIVHLHGLVPRDGSIEHGNVVTPVVGELDYVEAAPGSFAATRALFRVAPVLLLGASMTDAPLLQALEATKARGFPRYALVSMGFKYQDEPERLRALRAAQLERFQHFGVTPIYVDYYFQVAQFVSELARRVQVGSSLRGLDGVIGTDLSYASRVAKWAQDWGATQKLPVGDNQEDDVNWFSGSLLSWVLDTIRVVLDVSASEVLKIEFWVRDRPDSYRGLRLWNSSASFHLQEESVRRAAFSNSSGIAAVQAFVAGRPISVRLKDGQSPNQRWRTYIATPVRLADPTGEYGQIPVGSLVIASMRGSESSSLTRSWKHDRMSEAMELLDALGDLLTQTHHKSWKSLHAAVR